MNNRRFLVVLCGGTTAIIVIVLGAGLYITSQKGKETQHRIDALTRHANAAIAASKEHLKTFQYDAALASLTAVRQELEQSGLSYRLGDLSSRLSSLASEAESAQRDYRRKVAQGYSVFEGQLLSPDEKAEILAERERREQQRRDVERAQKEAEERAKQEAERRERERRQQEIAEKEKEARELDAARQAQKKKQESEEAKARAKMVLKPLNETLDGLAFGKVMWSLSVEYNKEPLLTRADALKHAATYKARDDETLYVVRYKTEITRLLERIKFVGDGEVKYFRTPEEKSSALPIRFVTWENDTCLLLVNVAIDTVYNTIKLSAKRRASEVVRTVCLKLLEDFDRSLFDTDVERYGVVVFYGSKNFLDRSVTATEPEAVCIVVSRNDSHEFLAGKTTADQLLRNSAVFISDRDAVYKFSRVELTLE
jgi:hypothetical protein